jgi:uncharacterized membrane protein
MEPTAWIAIWAVLFLATHLGISSGAVRPRLIAAVGEQPYRGIYSLAAAATLALLIIEFANHKHSGPLLWYLRAIAPIRWLAWLLMLLALIFLIASLINPSPATIGAPTRENHVSGVLKITRHSGFVGFTLFGVAHMLMNGWAGDVVFFGTFPALGILGGWHQDIRKLREIGDKYRAFVDQTSFFPGAALLSGRQHWQSSDMPWAAVAAGLIVTVALILLHPYLFGGHPLG